MSRLRIRLTLLRLKIGRKRLRRLQARLMRMHGSLYRKSLLPRELTGVSLKELSISQQTKTSLMDAMTDWLMAMKWLESLLETKASALRESLRQR